MHPYLLLSQKLNLPRRVVLAIREEKIIKSTTSGRKVMFDHKSVDNFMKKFNVKNHLTVNECKKLLVEKGYYDIYNPLKTKVYKTKPNKRRGFCVYPLGFSVTVKKLIEREMLDTVKFGTTVYITKKSFDIALSKLDMKYNELYPQSTLRFEKNNKPKLKYSNNIIKIKLKKIA